MKQFENNEFKNDYEHIIHDVFDGALYGEFSLADVKVHSKPTDLIAARDALNKLSEIASDLAKYHDYLRFGETDDNKRGKEIAEYYRKLR